MLKVKLLRVSWDKNLKKEQKQLLFNMEVNKKLKLQKLNWRMHENGNAKTKSKM